MSSSRRIVIVGTGTGVGKTHVACALLRAAGRLGLPAAGLKPVESGVGSGGSAELSDQERLSAAAAFHVKPTAEPFHVKHALYSFPMPVSPHLAARKSGTRIDLGAVRRWVEDSSAPLTLVETAGGLFSPLGPGLTNLHLLQALEPCIALVVAPDRLGVLHDVSATLGLATARGRDLYDVVLCAPPQTDASTGTNQRELHALHLARVLASFPRAPESEPDSLRAADAVLTQLGIAAGDRT